MKKSSNREFEHALMKQLVKFDMRDDLLKRISNDITNIYNMDIIPEKVWVQGKPDPSGFRIADGVVVQSRIKASALDRLKDLMRLDEFISVEIFPVGIIAPEALELEVRLGNKVDNAMRNARG